MSEERRVSPAPGALASLVSRLKSRANLVGVVVSSAPVAVETSEYIEFTSIDEGAEFGAIGRMRKDHEFTLSGNIVVDRDGTDDEVATAARERCYALMEEIEDELRATLEGLQLFNERGRRQTLTSRLAQRNLDQAAGPSVRRAWISFTIDCFDQTVG